MADEEFLTVPEVAARLRVSERWVYTNLSALPHVRLGRAIRFSRTAVDRFMAGDLEPAPAVATPDLAPVGGRRKRA